MEELQRLEEKIRRLKREYDMFLAGQRKGEPTALRAEVEREVLRMTRYPFPSTAARFKMGSLAHQFRALDTQFRNVLEQREVRRKDAELGAEVGEVPSVVVDQSAIEAPLSVERHVRSLHKALVESLGERPAPSLETFRARLLKRAESLVARPGVRAVRFTIASGETGPKIRGEILHGAPIGGLG